jgi:4-alpha-glucanotransferase
MPIYVALDSVDVWKDPKQFLLDENYNPVVVAGCPPDAFTPEGQLWGNPIYNWDLMIDEKFLWWCERLETSFNTYDILRIDHFRGFAGYYSIPYGEKNAISGKWNSAPGIDLFKTIKAKYPKGKIIAEDLGFITDDVRELLEETGFPGMKILQFAFFDDDSEYLPRMYKNSNCIVYTGSHDSDCTKTWVEDLIGDTLFRFIDECPQNKQSKVYSLIELALNSKANLSIIPLQDYLELPNEIGRMNTPATASGNWVWRVDPSYYNDELLNKIKDVTIKTGRG